MQRLFDVLARANKVLSCTENDLESWLDQTAISALKRAGILTSKETAGVITCPECGTHPVSPVFRGAVNDGARRYVITCNDPSVGTFDYIANLTSYTLDISRLAKAISSGLGLNGDIAELVPGQMFILGVKNTKQGSIRCYLLLSEDIQRHKEILQDSSKTASTIVLYAHTVTIPFIDSVAVIHLSEALTLSKGGIKVNETPINHASSRLFGENSYENGILSVSGVPIANIASGTKLDIVLSHLSSSKCIDKPIRYSEILEHYNKNKQKRKNGPEKIFGAEGWCDQCMTDLRNKCGDQANLVDRVIQRGGKKNGENTLIFRSRTIGIA